VIARREIKAAAEATKELEDEPEAVAV